MTKSYTNNLYSRCMWSNTNPNLFQSSHVWQSHKQRSSLLPRGNLLFKFGDIVSFPLICHYNRTFNRLSWCFFLKLFSISLPLKNQLLSHSNDPHSYFSNSLLFLYIFLTYFPVPQNSWFFLSLSVISLIRMVLAVIIRLYSWTLNDTSVSTAMYPLVCRSFK